MLPRSSSSAPGVLVVTEVDPAAAAELTGRAEIDSTPGQGTRVRVTIPR